MMFNDICVNSNVTRLFVLLGITLNIIKILVPIIIILMGIKDYFNAVTNSDPETIKKSTQTLFKRIIAGIIIFFIPTIVSYAITLVDLSEEFKDKYASCTTCLLDVSSCSADFSSVYEDSQDENNVINNEPNTYPSNQEDEEIEDDDTEEENDPDKPQIKSLTNKGLILTITADQNKGNIAGYYFSYNQELPDKTTGGYVATSDESLDIVRLTGTTYVWVEDKDGNISGPKKISINSNEIKSTNNKNYTILKGTSLSSYLESKGSSVEELNNLMARSVRAAGLYTKEAVATSALSFSHVLAEQYGVKIPYQSAGIRKEAGALEKWGAPKSNAEASNEMYYGLDCSGFVNWVYANAGFGINSRVYYWGSSVPRVPYSAENGDIGDVLVYGKGNQKGRHVRLIVGKTDTDFIIAESSGSGVAITTQSFKKDGGYEIQKADFLIDPQKNPDYYYNTAYPTGY